MNRHFIEKSTHMCINKHVKRCSKSLVIRKMRMKTTTGHHYWSTRITKTKKKRTLNIGEDMEKLYQLHFAVGKRKWYI